MSTEKNTKTDTVSPSPMQSYTPVPYEFRELVLMKMDDQQEGRIFFFNEQNVFDSLDGKVERMEEIEKAGEFVFFKPEGAIRADRIITLYGKPGPAYDEYDRYGNVCFECTGGYDL